MNKDFEHFGLSPKKEKEEKPMEDEHFALSPSIIMARQAQQAHHTGKAALRLEAAAL